MSKDRFCTFLLLVIAVSLGALAVRSYVAPPPVMADTAEGRLFIEPGTFMLRAPDGSQQVMGKVVVDLRTGKIWGFPTLSQDPYPATGANTTPQTSHPFLLGKYALTDIDK